MDRLIITDNDELTIIYFDSFSDAIKYLDENEEIESYIIDRNYSIVDGGSAENVKIYNKCERILRVENE